METELMPYNPPPPIDARLVVGDADVSAFAGIPLVEDPTLPPDTVTMQPNTQLNWGWPTLEALRRGEIAEILPELNLPTDDAERKKIQLYSGLFGYFMAALVEVAKCSYAGNLQHYGNADKLQWVQAKSNKHADKILSHLADHGKFDTDGIRHSAKVAWRALALLQMEMQEAGAPMPRSAV
jgi:hypothetical protein